MKSNFLHALRSGALALLAGAPAVLCAANAETPGWMVFNVPALAAPAESAASVAFLNTEEAGTHGFIRVKDGHFVDDRDVPLRFYGTNFSGESNFPINRETANALAKRIRQLGMNVVRLHGLDADHPYYLSKGLQCWDKNGKFSEEQLRKVDCLIAAMNREGIYVIINLHCGWTYPVFPDGGFAKNERMYKINGYWHRPFIERQKVFADNIMGRLNTETGVKYADNPGVLSVEMNNEDTFIEHGANANYYELTPGSGPRAIYPQLPPELQKAFRKVWTDYLKNKYGSFDILANAWGAGSAEKPSTTLVPEFFAYNNSRGKMQPTGDGAYRISANRLPQYSWDMGVRFKIDNPGNGKHCSIRFKIRSLTPKKVRFYARMEQPPYQHIGLEKELSLTPEWQDVSVSEVLKGSEYNRDKHTVIGVLEYGAEQGDIEFRDLVMKAGNQNLLKPDDNFETGIHVPAVSEGPADRDFREFTVNTQIATVKELKEHLRTIGVKVPIINTQTPYGGVSGQWATHVTDDYCDTHDYFQHPNFSGLKITTQNSAIVGDPFGGTLPMSAILREQGKPFVFSESSTPNHNDHGADMLPLNSIFLSIQDIDALTTHSYAHCTNKYDENIGMDAFMIAGRANVVVHYPFASLLFRQRRMPMARATSTLVAPTFDMLDNSALDYSTQHLLAYRTTGSHLGSYSSRFFFVFDENCKAPYWQGAKAIPRKTEAGAVASEDGSFLLYQKAKPGPYATLNLPDAKMLTGHVGGSSFTVGDVRFDIAARPWPDKNLPAFSCTTLISLDGKPISESKKMLLASSGMTEAQNLKLSEDRKTVDAKASNSWGDSPNVSETVAFDVTLPGAPYKLTVLDGAGMRKGEPRNSVNGKVRITHEDRSLWFLLER